MKYYVTYAPTGVMTGFYADVLFLESVVPQPHITITEEQHAAIIAEPAAWRVQGGALVAAPPPTAAEVAATIELRAQAELRRILEETLLEVVESLELGTPLPQDIRAERKAVRDAHTKLKADVATATTPQAVLAVHETFRATVTTATTARRDKMKGGRK